MDKLKSYLLKTRQFLANFQKVDKKKKSPKLKKVNKQTVNYLVLGGIGTLVLVGFMGSVRAITLSGQVTNLEKTIKAIRNKTPEAVQTKQNVDNSLQYYLNNFVYAYFYLPSEGEKQQAHVDYLNSFYNFTPDVKAQGQVRNPSELLSAQLVSINSNIATYRVRYKETIRHDKDTEEKEVTTAFNLPFGEKSSKYYVSGLPWFSTLQSDKAGGFDDEDKLELSSNDSFSEKKRDQLKKFLTIFFTNYTNNQDNLNLISKKVDMVANTTFKTLDYTYFKKEGQNTIAYVQATFEVAGSTHSENFTFTLSQKEDGYYVENLEHTIPLNYDNDKE